MEPRRNQLVFPFPTPATTDRFFTNFTSFTSAVNFDSCPPGQKGIPCDPDSGILIGDCCWPRLEIGQPCIRDEQCSWQHYLAKCRDRVCRCPLFMVAVENPTGYGMICATNCPSTFVPDRKSAICRQVEYREPLYPYKDDYDSPSDIDSDSVQL